MWFGVLGPIEVKFGDHEVAIGRRKERAVLALLLAAPNQTVPLDRMLDLLWGDELPDQATSSLHAYISNLRRRLEPDRAPRAPATRLVTRPPGYALVVQPGELDARLFESLIADAEKASGAGDLHEADRLMGEGLDLWRGPAYGEFANEPFAIPEVIRLGELREATVEDRMEIHLAMGRAATVIAEAEAVVAAAPTRERAWGHLMLALYQAGRQTEALQAFQRCRHTLADQAGVDPGPELQRLESRILTHDPELLRVRPEVKATPSSTASRPPTTAQADESVSGVVGRRTELDLLGSLLAASAAGAGRIALVSGEAGVGKTSLVAELIRRADSLGVRSVVARWPETLDRPAFTPWYGILDGLDAIADDVLEPVRAAIVDARTPTVGGLVGRIVGAIIASASVQPVLLVCDDVQWAEELSQDLIRQLLEAVESQPVMMVLIRRDPSTDEQPGLSATLSTLGRLTNVTRIDLGGLSPEDVTEMIERATHITPTSSIATAIHQKTGGNAFYALELGRLLGAEGGLTAGELSDDVGVPTSVRDVLRRRLTRMPDQAVAVLGMAAVLGSDVEPRLVQRVADIDLGTVADQLDLAEAAGFLRKHRSRVGRYRFAHELVRSAIVESLPGLHAARLHARSIDAIVDLYGEHDARIVHRLARHAVAAVEVLGPEQAALRLNASAIASRSMLNLDRTLTTFQRALELTKEMPASARRAELESEFIMRVAQTTFLLRGVDDGIKADFNRAIELSRSGGDCAMVNALSGFGAHAVLWGDVLDSVQVGRRLLALDRPIDSVETNNGRYLAGFAALIEPDPTADRTMADTPHVDGRVVRWTTRAAALGFVEIIDGHPATGSRRALNSAEQALGDPTADAWELAWTLLFATSALLLADDDESVARVIDRLPPHSAGIAMVDLTVEASTAWVRLKRGDPTSLGTMNAARAALRNRDGMLFWIVLTLAQAKAQFDTNTDPRSAGVILAEARGHIEQRGLQGLLPWCTELETLLAPA